LVSCAGINFLQKNNKWYLDRSACRYRHYTIRVGNTSE
jgi:hypothetical protein